MPNLGAPSSALAGPSRRASIARRRDSISRQQTGDSEFNEVSSVEKTKNQKEVNEFIKKLTKIDDAAHNAAKLRPPKIMNSPSNGSTKIAGTEGSTRNLISRRSKADAELNLIRKKGLAVKFYRQFTELELEQARLQKELEEFERMLAELRQKYKLERASGAEIDTSANQGCAADYELEQDYLNKKSTLSKQIRKNNERMNTLAKMTIDPESNKTLSSEEERKVEEANLEEAVKRGGMASEDAELSSIDTNCEGSVAFSQANTQAAEMQQKAMEAALKELNESTKDTWLSYFSEEYGRSYYYNPTTGEIVWELPDDASVTSYSHVDAGPVTPARSNVSIAPSKSHVSNSGSTVVSLNTRTPTYDEEHSVAVSDFTRTRKSSVASHSGMTSQTRRRQSINRRRRLRKQRNRKIIIVAVFIACVGIWYWSRYKANLEKQTIDEEDQKRLFEEQRFRELMEEQEKLKREAAEKEAKLAAFKKKQEQEKMKMEKERIEKKREIERKKVEAQKAKKEKAERTKIEAEKAKLEAEKKKMEELRVAEEARLAAELEEIRKIARLAQEEAEKMAKEAAELKAKIEAEERARLKKIEEEKEAKLAEERRILAEEQRMLAEEKRKHEEKLAEEKRIREKKKAEEKRQAEIKAEQNRRKNAELLNQRNLEQANNLLIAQGAVPDFVVNDKKCNFWDALFHNCQTNYTDFDKLLEEKRNLVAEDVHIREEEAILRFFGGFSEAQ
uniref:WW domain-containing protein n=2 Tax=Leptocylindrus danicus TaxID=163516 RepID=A0A7S2LMN0_9STRA|mmetsp:Transcript_7663/g.11393  ORF Transcript_7663/g.11393 Transcript_7663/m.11393 type:complete len:732 (+) Transcript_7663:75-2270(+)